MASRTMSLMRREHLLLLKRTNTEASLRYRRKLIQASWDFRSTTRQMDAHMRSMGATPTPEPAWMRE